MVKPITIVYWRRKGCRISHTCISSGLCTPNFVTIPLGPEEKKAVIPMQRSLCSVSSDAEKGLRFELHYLLVITAFPMSLTQTYH